MKQKLIAIVCAMALLGSLFAVSGCEPTETAVKPVYYSDFGAVGDGESDDFEAIVAAHEYANENNRPVKADRDALYYIGAHNATAIIKTDTDWSTAEFIIDDTEVEVANRSYNIFEVASDYESYSVELPDGYSLKEGQTNIGLTFDTPVMLSIVNSNKKDYIRYGNNQNSGSSRQEIILVDEEGNVDEDTPILWDYDEVTSMTVYSADDDAITIQGGVFTTIANTQPVSSGYYGRGLNVKRSNTTVLNVEHYITGEPVQTQAPSTDPPDGDTSAPYSGFYVINYANNVTLQGCVMTGHRSYKWIKTTGQVTQGTYDTQAGHCNNVSWIDCTQSNDITDSTYWGVMASNFCKNLVMDGCSFSRFDAHQGVYNATVRNTVLGTTFNVIGAGTLLVENVTRLDGSTFLTLRTDYGSTWEGDIIFRNCTMETGGNVSLITGSWTDWDFGYTCYLPTTVTVENFTASEGATCYVFASALANLDAATVAASGNPYVVTEKVIVINENAPVAIASNLKGLFAGTVLERQ